MLNQRGSGIICVLMAMAGLLTLMGLVVRYTTYGIDIAHQRALQEQRYFALKGLLNYGVMLANKTAVSDLSEPLNIKVEPWLTNYMGKIVLSNKQDDINVHAYLYITPEEFIDIHQTISKKPLNS